MSTLVSRIQKAAWGLNYRLVNKIYLLDLSWHKMIFKWTDQFFIILTLTFFHLTTNFGFHLRNVLRIITLRIAKGKSNKQTTYNPWKRDFIVREKISIVITRGGGGGKLCFRIWFLAESSMKRQEICWHPS